MIYSDFMELQNKESNLFETMGFKKIREEKLNIREEKLNLHEKELIESIKKQDPFYKSLTFKAIIVSRKNIEYRLLADNNKNYYEI